MCRRTKTAALTILLGVVAGPVLAQQHPDRGWIVIAASSEKPAGESASKETRQLSPEEKMQRRFPQPARVGDLIGLPVLDDNDRTIGHIKLVVQNAGRKAAAHRDVRRLSWMASAAGGGSDRGCRHCRASARRSRHDQGGVRCSTSLERSSDDAGRAGRCHSHCLVQALTKEHATADADGRQPDRKRQMANDDGRSPEQQLRALSIRCRSASCIGPMPLR